MRHAASRRTKLGWSDAALLAACLCAGCELRTGKDDSLPPSTSIPPTGSFGGNAGFGGGGPGSLIPPVPTGGTSGTDSVLPTVTASVPPPPVSGGTLLVTRDGQFAVAADPDRDRVTIVSIEERIVLHTVLLDEGDEPGRLVEDADGRVHVALRKAGALVSIDVATGTVIEQRAVCGVPRGIAYDEAKDQVHVACAGGELVSFDAAGGDAVRTLHLDVDLRDVVVTPNGLFVSRFKSAELLRVNAAGQPTARIAARGVTRHTDRSLPQLISAGGSSGGTPQLDAMEPAVAWRTVASPDGALTMLHQYAFAGDVLVGGSTGPTTGYGTRPGSCGGLVQPGVTRIEAEGTVRPGKPLLDSVLAIDVASSPDSQWLAVAAAGIAFRAFDPSGLPGLMNVGRVDLYAPTALVTDATLTETSCARASINLQVEGQATAVAFNPTINLIADTKAETVGTWLIAQTRDPATLVFFHNPSATDRQVVPLGGNSVLDTGHELFHRDAGMGIACASCHAEGQEDGRVWHFDPIGPRRTQSIDVGLAGSAPFHWDGDMTSFDTLIDEVMVHRMGSAAPGFDQRAALATWVFSLSPRAPVIDAKSEAAQRGALLFASEGVGCATCHDSKNKFMSNVSANVGTTEAGHTLQVPSLLGVAYRAPFLHDGRARTLRERFDPAKGGGDAHGHTSQLTPAQIDDLVAYLGSL